MVVRRHTRGPGSLADLSDISEPARDVSRQSSIARLLRRFPVCLRSRVRSYSYVRRSRAPPLRVSLPWLRGNGSRVTREHVRFLHVTLARHSAKVLASHGVELSINSNDGMTTPDTPISNLQGIP